MGYLNIGARNTQISLYRWVTWILELETRRYLWYGWVTWILELETRRYLWYGWVYVRECKIQCIEPDVIINPGYTYNIKQTLSNSKMFLNMILVFLDFREKQQCSSIRKELATLRMFLVIVTGGGYQDDRSSYLPFPRRSYPAGTRLMGRRTYRSPDDPAQRGVLTVPLTILPSGCHADGSSYLPFPWRSCPAGTRLMGQCTYRSPTILPSGCHADGSVYLPFPRRSCPAGTTLMGRHTYRSPDDPAQRVPRRRVGVLTVPLTILPSGYQADGSAYLPFPRRSSPAGTRLSRRTSWGSCRILPAPCGAWSGS